MAARCLAMSQALWTRYFAPDSENRISLACRALLVEVGARKILLETGIGVFFAPKCAAASVSSKKIMCCFGRLLRWASQRTKSPT